MPEALKCPSCSAPLDYPPGGGATMRCPYCNTIVMLAGNSSSNERADDSAAGLGPLFRKAMEISQVVAFLRQGKRIQAIQFIRETHGVDLVTARAIVDHISATRSDDNAASTTIVPTSGFRFAHFLAFFGLIVAIVIVVVMHSVRKQVAGDAARAISAAVPALPAAPVVPAAPTFAHMAMEFGAEGIGAGHFKDSRSIAMDGAGHIYVGEFSDGRVQVFDQQGRFITEWSVGPKKYLMNLTADVTGRVYAVIPFEIFRYEGLTGAPLGKVENTNGDVQESYVDAFAALNGDVYAVASNSDIVIIGQDGKIKSAFNASQKVGEDVSFDKIVAIPTGDIYALDRQRGVFRFAADGRYINRFGNVDASSDGRPGHLFSANNIAADDSGRIYVSNADPAVLVFDGNGSYLGSFGPNDVAFGLAINLKDEIFACFRNQHVIRKFVLDDP